MIIKELLEVTKAMREWIDAVPQETVLPAMPGFDRDWADSVITLAEKQTSEVLRVLWIPQLGMRRPPSLSSGCI